MKRVLIPWKMPHYQAINGFHPLFSGLLQHPQPDITYLFPDPDEEVPKSDLDQIIMTVMAQAFDFGQKFGQAGEAYGAEVRNYLGTYIETRDLRAQAQIYAYRDRADLVFHHTTPLHLSSMPFVLHFESLTTLFYPFLLHGYNSDVELRRELIFRIVRERLESSACRVIFTHIQTSADIVRQSFASEMISAKVRYVPLGVGIPADFSERVEQKLRVKPGNEAIRILFTNSAHAAGQSFLLRGGHDLLVAFQQHRSTFPQSTLTIVSSGYEAFAQVHPDLLEGVEWIEQGIEDEKLFNLLVEADVFALPAAGLHSYSVLRAMRCGAALICSDAPGYEEFVEDGKTAFVVKGRRGEIYSLDPETGWWRDDYQAMKKFNPAVIEQLVGMFDFLAKNPDQRQDMARRALAHVLSRHAIEPWGESVAELLRAA